MTIPYINVNEKIDVYSSLLKTLLSKDKIIRQDMEGGKEKMLYLQTNIFYKIFQY